MIKKKIFNYNKCKFTTLFILFATDDLMSDFEQGLQNALRQTWPDAKVRGCRFHFGQGNNFVFHILVKDKFARTQKSTC